MLGVQLMGILLVGTSLKFGKGKGPAKKSKGSDDDDDGDSDGGSITVIFIPQPKHMLWVLKRTLSMRRFF